MRKSPSSALQPPLGKRRSFRRRSLHQAPAHTASLGPWQSQRGGRSGQRGRSQHEGRGCAAPPVRPLPKCVTSCGCIHLSKPRFLLLTRVSTVTTLQRCGKDGNLQCLACSDHSISVNSYCSAVLKKKRADHIPALKTKYLGSEETKKLVPALPSELLGSSSRPLLPSMQPPI